MIVMDRRGLFVALLTILITTGCVHRSSDMDTTEHVQAGTSMQDIGCLVRGHFEYRSADESYDEVEAARSYAESIGLLESLGPVTPYAVASAPDGGPSYVVLELVLYSHIALVIGEDESKGELGVWYVSLLSFVDDDTLLESPPIGPCQSEFEGR